jgi:serine/threonine-protein kinase
MKTIFASTLAGLIGLLVSSAQAQEGPADLSKQAYAVLKRHCYRCHGVEYKVEGFNILNRDSLLAEDTAYVVPGKLDDSQIWARLGVYGDMPPRSVAERPSDAEVAIIRQWIESGAAAFPSAEIRPFVGERVILSAIRDHLQSLPKRDRKHQRYFTLTHLYNNAKVTDDELRLYRAALSKVVNSLTRSPDIVLPKPIDPQQTVFAIDLRDVGWEDPERWLEVVKLYPYGLERNDNPEPVRDLFAEVTELQTGDGLISDGIPYLRADWFVTKASRPPLYHTLLRLPDTQDKLETELGVSFKDDFLRGKLARAAFTQSGVSRSNRLIDRHTGAGAAYYYKSHDFGKSNGRGVLFRFPLGPKFDGNPFDAQAYEQDGGEIIFSLANGMQGYLIVDGEGKRIDEAPVKVVRDPTEISGSPVVVNGISCMGCHKTGIQRFKDNIRDSLVLSGEARDKITQLYRSNEELDRLQQRDTLRFMAALEAATGPFLKQADDASKPIDAFPEPIAAAAHLHDADVGLEEAAKELGLSDPAQLASAIRTNIALQRLGLGPLAEGYKIPRAMWDSREDFGGSVFQVTARELGLGIPINQN